MLIFVISFINLSMFFHGLELVPYYFLYIFSYHIVFVLLVWCVGTVLRFVPVLALWYTLVLLSLHINKYPLNWIQLNKGEDWYAWVISLSLLPTSQITCNFPAFVLPTRNLQNINDKHADKPTTKCATPYHIHMLPLLNCAMTGNSSF